MEPTDIPPKPRMRSASRRGLRILSILLAFGPLIVPVILSALWVRSLWTPERWERQSWSKKVDFQAGRAFLRHDTLVFESGFGVGGVEWTQATRPEPVATAEDIGNFLQQSTPATSFQSTRTRTDDSLFGRRPEEVGPWRTWHWGGQSDPWLHPAIFSDWTEVSHSFAAPYWLWMLPFTLPPVWWLWCPQGHAFPRLNLRRLAVVMATVAVILGVIVALGRASEYDRALGTIAKFGGLFGYEDVNGRSEIYAVAFQPEWSPINEDVSLLRPALAHLPRLKMLRIHSRTIMAGVGRALIDDQPDIESLGLWNSGIDDQMLRSLDAHERLWYLKLSGTKVTDFGLESLAHMPGLESLEIEDLSITEAGLEHLHRLPNLKRVSMKGNAILIRPEAIERLFHACPKLSLVVMPDGESARRHD